MAKDHFAPHFLPSLLMSLLFVAHYIVTLAHYVVICCSLTRQRVTHELVRSAHEFGGPLRCPTSSLPFYLLLIKLLFVTFVCLYYEG